MALGKILLKVTKIFFLVTIVLLVVIILFLHFFFSGLCGNDFLDSKISPDEKSKIVIFLRNCGATTDFSVQASIVSNDFRLNDNSTGNLFTADSNDGTVTQANNIGGPRITSEWVGTSTLQIQYAHGARFFKQERRYQGVNILYSELPLTLKYSY